MTLSPTIRLAAGLLALWGAGSALLVAPAWRQRASSCEELRSLRAQAAMDEVGERELERLRAQLDVRQRDAAGEIAEIPDSADVAMLIGAMSRQLDRLGVPGREVSTGALRDASDAQFIPVSITLKGPFLSVYASLRWIESLPRMVRLSRARIDRGGGAGAKGEQSGEVRAELTLDVFFNPKPLSDALTSAGSSQ